YLTILYSTDAGVSFTEAGTFANSVGWTSQFVQIPSNSPKTIVRFRGTSDGLTGSDIGVDNVKVLPPCTGAPVPGTISSASPCEGENFTLELQGASQAAGLTYQWYDSLANGVWTPI